MPFKFFRAAFRLKPHGPRGLERGNNGNHGTRPPGLIRRPDLPPPVQDDLIQFLLQRLNVGIGKGRVQRGHAIRVRRCSCNRGCQRRIAHFAGRTLRAVAAIGPVRAVRAIGSIRDYAFDAASLCGASAAVL